MPQVPSVHVGRALAREGHTVPQTPQLVTSLASVAQVPLLVQYAVPLGQVLTQLTPAQRIPDVQRMPHAPQFVFVLMGVSQPSLGSWLQSP